MRTYDELKALIEQRGVHPEFGEPGENWGIEQNPHELATFLVRMQELGIQSVLEIGTGYKGGLSRFLAQEMGWDVTSVDVNAYHHVYEGVNYIVAKRRLTETELGHQLFDLVFIDGNHSYDEVRNDLFHYMDFAVVAIAFHDILGLRECEGVKRVWNKSIRKRVKHEAIASSNPSGIGWVEVGLL